MERVEHLPDGTRVVHAVTAEPTAAACPSCGVFSEKSWEPYPVTVHTSADPSRLRATLRATWPGGVCTDTGIYYGGAVDLPLLEMYSRGVHFVTARVDARSVIPEVIDVLADGCDLSPAVDRVARWEDAAEVWPTMTGKTVFVRD